jgi:hypothetical protein
MFEHVIVTRSRVAAMLLTATFVAAPAISQGADNEKFDYTLTVTARDGEQDVQHGSVDLSKQIVPDVNSFGVEPGGNVDVGFSGPTGTSLWLLQNNIPLAQPALSLHIAKKK